MAVKIKRRKFSPKEFAEERDYGFRRIMGHEEIVGYEIVEHEGKLVNVPITNHVGGILELLRPTTADLWWARKFLKQVIANPFVPRGKNVENQGPMARAILDRLNREWPEPKKYQITRLKERPPIKKCKKQSQILSAKCALRGVNIKLKAIKNRVLHWERVFGKMSLSHPKWRDTYDKLKLLRQEQLRLQTHQKNLKARLA